jgi:multimeric flavodoxin WrbA
MKITVITGSPHKNGTSALLADKFIEGAIDAGNEVFRFDAAFEDVKPCLACDYCASHDGECVRKDAMNEWYGKLIDSDMVVFVTPIYYYTMSAQIKVVVDRFHANNEKLAGNKKAMILATAYGPDYSTMEGLDKTYEAILRFMNWEDAGKLFATSSPIREMLEQTDFPNQAYELGKSIQ